MKLSCNNYWLDPHGAKSSDFQHLRFGQLGRSGLFASGCASLRRCVFIVLSSGAFKQIGGITTKMVVAFVANIQIRPDSGCDKEANAMGQITSLLVGMAGAKSSVASPRRFNPSPAFSLWALTRGLVNLAPKTLDVLRGQLRRVYINSSHVSLLERSVWSGSSDCFRSQTGRLYFSTECA